jgi:hypothetical protein
LGEPASRIHTWLPSKKRKEGKLSFRTLRAIAIIRIDHAQVKAMCHERKPCTDDGHWSNVAYKPEEKGRKMIVPNAQGNGNL